MNPRIPVNDTLTQELGETSEPFGAVRAAFYRLPSHAAICCENDSRVRLEKPCTTVDGGERRLSALPYAFAVPLILSFPP